MREVYKTEEQFTSELAGLRQRVAELEALESEYKRAEEVLKESQEVLRKIFEAVTEANQRTGEMHGFSSKDEVKEK